MSSRRFSVRGVTYEVTTIDVERVRVEGPGVTPVPVRVRRIGPTVVEVVAEDLSWRRLVHVSSERDRSWAFTDGDAFDVSPERAGRSGPMDADAALEAPMPATVIDVRVEPGQHVQSGETLLVLEAMKMELPVRAPVAGLVARVGCEVGELVHPGGPLVELVPNGPVKPV